MFLNLNLERPGCAPRPRSGFRPRLELLEGRDTPSTTVLAVAPNPATLGQAVTLTATVSESGLDDLQPGLGAPPGSITFFDGPTSLGKVNVTPTAGTTNQGTAQLTTSSLVAGTHSLTAAYSGEVNPVPVFLVTSASTSPAVSETINPVPAPTPAAPVDVTARVSVAVRRGLPRGQQLVTVTNTSGQAISGPLYLVFTRLPRRVRLRGASGMTQAHNPFLLDAVTLLPGGYANFLVSFSGHKAVRFTDAVFAGAGPL
jgi:hypothetical protein